MVRAHVHPVAIYLLLQATAITAWWSVLWWVPATRAPFLPDPDWPEAVLLAFALPDLALVVAGSAAAAFGLQRQADWSRPVLWFVTGAVAYATLWCLLGSLIGGGWLGSVAMLACSLGTGWSLHATRR